MSLANALRNSVSYLSELALLAPSICAALYAFSSTEGTLGNRFVAAFAMAVAVPMVALLASILSLALAATLLRIENTDEAIAGLAVQHVLAGLFMVTFIWIWWQHDKRTAMGEVAQCAAEAVRTRDYPNDSASILACFHDQHTQDGPD